MPNMKITDVSEHAIKRSMFENKTSYSRFIKGFKFLQRLQQMKDLGFIIFHGGVPIPKEDNFIFDLEADGTMPKIGTGDERFMSMWLGSTMGLKEDTVYVEKEEMDIFKNIEYIDPSHIKKMSSL